MQLTTNTSTLNVVNAYDIYIKDLPPTKWYVGSLIHEGATLLSGDPKVGKSFLALQIAIAVAGGASDVCGNLAVGVHGRVLYMALDDASEKRIHKRLHELTEDRQAIRNIDFVYQRDLPSISGGLLDMLAQHLAGTRYVMVILDTLGAALDPERSTKNIYRADYAEAVGLQKLAQEFGISFLILHHTNKGDSASPVARASGSHGLTGAVDSVMMLYKDEFKSCAILSACPRDGESSEVYLERLENGTWNVTHPEVVRALGTQAEQSVTREQEEVRSVLRDGPKSPSEVAQDLDLNLDTARKRLSRMAQAGLIEKQPDGRYALRQAANPDTPQYTLQMVALDAGHLLS